MAKTRSSSKKRRRVEEDDEPRSKKRRRRPPEAEDYLPEDEMEEDDDDFDDDDEDEDDEPPRRRRKPSRSSRSRRARYDDDDDDDEDDDYDDDEDEDDEPPRRRRSRRSRDDDDDDDYDDDDDDDEDEDEDDEPRARKGKKKSRSKEEINIEGGWGEFNRQKSKGSKYPDRFKPTAEQTVVKFLDDEPFANYRQHWFNELRGVDGLRMGHVCPDKNCPACDTLGDTPSLHALFNIVVFDEDGEPDLMVLDCGSKLGNAVEQHAKSEKTGPLTRHYYAISVTGKGKGGAYNPQVQVIKERDLEEDWDILPLDDEELDEFEEDRYGKKSVDRPDPKSLDKAVQYIVEGIEPDDDDDDDRGRRPRSKGRKKKSRRR